MSSACCNADQLVFVADRLTKSVSDLGYVLSFPLMTQTVAVLDACIGLGPASDTNRPLPGWLCHFGPRVRHKPSPPGMVVSLWAPRLCHFGSRVRHKPSPPGMVVSLLAPSALQVTCSGDGCVGGAFVAVTGTGHAAVRASSASSIDMGAEGDTVFSTGSWKGASHGVHT